MKRALAIAVACATVATPAVAEELKKLPDRLDPSKAYVLVELGSLDETGIKGEIVLARYDAEAGDVLGHGPSEAGLDKKSMRAVHESVRKGFVKDKERHTRLHLLELEPDLYVVEAANGTSFSLGSRTFRAEPGTVTDLGVVAIATDWAEGEGPPTFGVGDAAKLLLFGAFAGPKQPPRPVFVTVHERSSGNLQLPAMLASRARAVTWEATDATFGNHLGLLVNRFGGRAERETRTADNQDTASHIVAAKVSLGD